MKRWVVVAFFAAISIFTVTAHPVSLNWVSLKIDDGSVSIRYRILVEDLVYFYRPDHDEFYNYQVETLRSLAKKHGELISRNFRILDQDSAYLSVKKLSCDDQALPDQDISLMDLMKYELIYEIEYENVSNDWDRLFMHQRVGKASVRIPVVTFLHAEENGRILLETSEISDDAPYVLLRYGRNEVDNPSELTSSYFTATNSGIRHELTIPTNVLNSLMGNPVNHVITRDQVYKYFTKYNTVEIAGSSSIPNVLELSTLSLDSKHNYTYLDISYPASVFPGDITLHWSDFNWRFRWLESSIMIEDSTYQHTFSRFQPFFRWKTEPMLEKN